MLTKINKLFIFYKDTLNALPAKEVTLEEHCRYKSTDFFFFFCFKKFLFTYLK